MLSSMKEQTFDFLNQRKVVEVEEDEDYADDFEGSDGSDQVNKNRKHNTPIAKIPRNDDPKQK